MFEDGKETFAIQIMNLQGSLKNAKGGSIGQTKKCHQGASMMNICVALTLYIQTGKKSLIKRMNLTDLLP